MAAVDALGLSAYVNQDVRTGLRMLVDGVPERYAVIDAGTNSTKFHLAELDLDGSWRTVVDRAVVTRLGEGLEATGEIGAVPLDRTAQAIGEMADEARSLDVRGIAVVGTAGLRISSNQVEVVETLRARSGLSLDVISGEDEARLAHLAVATGVGLDDGAIVVFDTGGGSSQFTFGHGPVVDERFSLDVGAVRFTEQFGLAEAVSADVVTDAVAAIATELGRLDGRELPQAVVAMGGAVTNLAAVSHGLTTYDPDVVQGTVLDRAEIDRQIELYRSPRTPLGGGRSPGCSRPAPRSSSPAPASSGPSWTSSAAMRSPSATAACGTAYSTSASGGACRRATEQARFVSPAGPLVGLRRAEPAPPGRRCRGCGRGRSARTHRPA